MEKYLILSKKWSKGSDNLVWWREHNCGYTICLEAAGRYTKEQIEAKLSYYDNDEQMPVLESVAYSKKVSVVPTDSATVKSLKTKTHRTKETTRRASSPEVSGE